VTEDELRTILAAEIARAEERSTGSQGTERAELLEYYYADADAGVLKNRPSDRSSVVSPDVRNTVETAMPQLMRIFTSGEEVVAFTPVGSEDIEAADQETKTVNQVVMTDNSGFLILHTNIKDACMARLGVGKVIWDNSEVRERETLEGLSDDDYTVLIDDDGVEVVSHDERIEEPEEGSAELVAEPMGMEPGEMGIPAPTMPAGGPVPMGAPPMPGMPGMMAPPAPVTVHDVTIVRKRKVDKVRIVAIPREEFGYSARTRDINSEEAGLLYHKRTVTVSELLSMGFDRKVIDTIPTDSFSVTSSPEAQVRNSEDGSLLQMQADAIDDASREVELIECYPMVDFDDDGIAERRKVFLGGGMNGIVLSNEFADNHPFYAISPILIPHLAEGLSFADLAKETQTVNSVLDRQLLDGVYLALNPRMELPEEANDGSNTIDDLLVPRPGAVVRTKTGGLLRPLVTQDTSQAVLGVRAFVESQGENRTGMTRYNQGLDANSLNKTATGIGLIQNASMMRLELVARVIAETGIKRMFLLVHDMLRKHSSKTIPLRMTGKYIAVDPRKWARRLDMNVSVGLGTGNTQQRLMMFGTILQRMQLLIQAQGGFDGPFVTAKNFYNALKGEAALMQIGSPDTFYTEPNPQAQQQQKPPPPDPKIVQAQAQMQIDQQKAQADLMLKQQDAQISAAADAQKLQADMAAKQQSAQADIQIARMKAQAEIEIAWAKAQADMQIKQMLAGVQASMTQQAAVAPQPGV